MDVRPHRQDDDRVSLAVMRGAQIAMVVTDPSQDDNPIVYANDAFLALTGYERHEIDGRNCRFLQGSDTDRETVQQIARSLAAGEQIAVDLLNYRKAGEPFWNALTISPVRDADGRLVNFVAVLVDASVRVARQGETERAEARRAKRIQALERDAEVQAVLIREIDHRAKNNLQMVSAMLNLQALSISDAPLRKTLREMLERVDALSLVHQRLYQLAQVNLFDLADFIRELARDVVGASGRRDIALDLQLAPVMIRSEDAASVGLILNEALTNAVKHAFGAGPGQLRVELTRSDTICTIAVADNGVGLPETAGRDATFGTTLVRTLVEQLHADLEWRRADPGTLFRLSFASAAPAA